MLSLYASVFLFRLWYFQVLDSYLKLSDWQSVMEWQEQLAKWRSDARLSSLHNAFNSSVDVNLIK
jgi:hypothetical protein